MVKKIGRKTLKKQQQEKQKDKQTQFTHGRALTKEEKEYVRNIDSNKMDWHMEKMSLRKLWKMNKDEKLKVDHRYQRKGHQWSKHENKSFIMSMLEETLQAAVITLADMREITGNNEFYHIVDGQQKNNLICDVFNDKIQLPSDLIPKSLGGGRFFSEAHPIIQELFFDHEINVCYTYPKNMDQVYVLYNRIQKGVPSSLGQEVRGHPTKYRDFLLKISEHPCMKRVSLRGDDRELAIALHLVNTVWYLEGELPDITYNKKPLVEFLELYPDRIVSKKTAGELYEILNYIENLLVGLKVYVRSFYFMVLVRALYVLLYKNEAIMNDTLLKQSFIKFKTTIHSIYNKDNLSEKESNQLKNTEYWDLVVAQPALTRNNAKIIPKFVELFLNEYTECGGVIDAK